MKKIILQESHKPTQIFNAGKPMDGRF